MKQFIALLILLLAFGSCGINTYYLEKPSEKKEVPPEPKIFPEDNSIYINDYAYDLYDEDNAPPGSVVINGLSGYIVGRTPLEEINRPITASFRELSNGWDISKEAMNGYHTSGYYLKYRYKQVGKIENGAVKIVLLPTDVIDAIPDEYFVEGWERSSDGIYSPSLIKVACLVLENVYIVKNDYIRLYYFTGDGKVLLSFSRYLGFREYQVKKGWAVALNDKLVGPDATTKSKDERDKLCAELITDDYRLAHLSEILEERGFVWTSPYSGRQNIVDIEL